MSILSTLMNPYREVVLPASEARPNIGPVYDAASASEGLPFSLMGEESSSAEVFLGQERHCQPPGDIFMSGWRR